MSDRLIVLAPAEGAAGWESLLQGTGEGSRVLSAGENEYQNYQAALAAGADYVLAVSAGCGLEPERFAPLWAKRTSYELLLGDASGRRSGVGEKLCAWLLKVVSSYSFRLFLRDGCPPFFLIRADKLREYLRFADEDFLLPDAVIRAAAYYKGDTVVWAPCTRQPERTAKKRFDRLLHHPFHALKTYRKADTAMAETYGPLTQSAEQRADMTLLDKLVALVNRETVSYLIFGLLTTVVNIVVYQGLNWTLGEKWYLLNNVIAWVFAVAFAYVTNKLLVFQSKSWKPAVVTKELTGFIGARLFSLAVEEAGLLLFIQVMHMGSLLAKIILQIIVVVLNYFFSKLFIFKKKK